MALRQFKGDKERKKTLKHLSKSRPLGPGLKKSLTDSRGILPGSHITLPVTTDHTLIGKEAIEGREIIDKYDLATRGGKKSRKKRYKKKKKSRKKKKKTRKRNKKGGILLTGSLGYYLYQTKMNGKKAIFNWPVQYVDPPQPASKPTPQAPTKPTPSKVKGGKRTRKRKRKKRRKTRKRRGGADSLRDGIRKIYEGKVKEKYLGRNGGPDTWGRQLNDLYDKYQKHLINLSKGQIIARKVKNMFRTGDNKKPLTEGEADRIFYDEAKKMIDILERNLLPPIRMSIQDINDNPFATTDYTETQRESDPEKQRLYSLVVEEKPRLESMMENIEGSIWHLERLIRDIKYSGNNSIPRNSSIETNFSDDSYDTAPPL